MSKKPPTPPDEPSPLTPEQFHTPRRAQETKERERLLKLRTDWNAYEQSVRVKSVGRK